MRTVLNSAEWSVVLDVIIGLNARKYPETHPRGHLPVIPSNPVGLRGLRRKVDLLAEEYFRDSDDDDPVDAQFVLELTLEERRALRYLLKIGPSLRPDLFDVESGATAISLIGRL